MFLIALTFLAALSVELLGTYVSVVGLASFLGADFIIMALAVALDAGKLIVVTLLYKFWSQLPKLLRAYMIPAAAVTMIITSVGAFGYLSAAFQTAILPTKESNIQIVALQEEKVRLQQRKQSIDTQIAQLPATSVRGRTKLMTQFKDEQTTITSRLFEIDKQLPELQTKNANVESHAGPILYVSEAFNVSVEEAVKWVIFLIIFVFDPLAVTLVLCGNFLIEQRKRVSNAGEEVKVVVDMTSPDIPIMENADAVFVNPTKRKRKKKPVIKPVEKALTPADEKEVQLFTEFLEKTADAIPPSQAYEEVYNEPAHLEELAEQVANIDQSNINIEERANEPVTAPVIEPPVTVTFEEAVTIDEPNPAVKSEKALNKIVHERSLDDLLKVTEIAEPVIEDVIASVEPIATSTPEFVSSLETQQNLPGSEITFDDATATSRLSQTRKNYK